MRVKQGPKNVPFPKALDEFISKSPEIQLMSLEAIDLMRELGREDISGREIATRISQDPVLSARVLRVANSSYYGTVQRISTISQAVTLLGLDDVRKLVHGLCMMDLSNPSGALADLFGRRAFAAHAMAVSHIAGCLAKRFGFQNLGRGEAETAGLLHDIGLCYLGSGTSAYHQPAQRTFWKELSQQIRQPTERSFPQLEATTLGFSHTELGGWLAGQWNLPSSIQEALRYHHGSINDSFNKEIASVVQLAQHICNRHGMDFLPKGSVGELDESVPAFIESQGRGQMLDALSQSISEEIVRAQDMYEMVSSRGEIPIEKLAEPPRKEPRRPGGPVKSRPRAVGSAPIWSFFVPGLPQILKGEKSGGVFFLTAFLISFCLFGFAAASGAPFIGGAFVLVSMISWLCSVWTA